MKTSLIVLCVMVTTFVLLNALDYSTMPTAATQANSTSDAPNHVVLYSAKVCGYCKQAKQLFKQKNVAYVECDVGKSAKCDKEFKALNGRGVPVFNIKGEIIHGYNKELILTVLKSKNISFN